MDIQKRFDRILNIYMLLQAKPLVRAQDLAVRFEVSLRTIYRDIQALQGAGVPIYGETGIGYALVQGYKIPPTSFTREEALSFAAAEKLIANYFDKDLYLHFSTAMNKMKSILRTADKEDIATVEEKVFLKPKEHVFNQKVPAALSILLKSIAQKVQVVVDYQKSGSATVDERNLEPIGLFHEHGFWYLMAYCLLRNDYRQFRLDRIQEIKLIANQRFTKQHEELAYYLKKDNDPEATVRVVIQVSKKFAAYMQWDRNYYGFVGEREMEDYIEMTFQCREVLHGFARWVLMFGDQTTIVEPEFLRDRVRELLQAQLARVQ
ncbi:YafY family transcriptional regulator [Sphingobacterium psychroaquaticum]|nr:YafY family transcriptional regulator [Sphingobacterium psychroaquaticum]